MTQIELCAVCAKGKKRKKVIQFFFSFIQFLFSYLLRTQMRNYIFNSLHSYQRLNGQSRIN